MTADVIMMDDQNILMELSEMNLNLTMQEEVDDIGDHYIILVDTSISMGSFMGKAVEGLNSFLKSLFDKYTNTNGKKGVITIATFSNYLEYVCKKLPIENLIPLDASSTHFKCIGCTALYNSIGEIIDEFEGSYRESTYFFIITDGDDNISKKYRKKDVDEMTRTMIQGGWSITHCSTEISHLNLPVSTKLIFEIDEIDEMFKSLRI